MSSRLDPNSLNEHVGTTFDVMDDPSNIFSLTFTKVVQHLKTERNEAFSLFFRGPRSPFIPQSIHKLKHAQLGEMDIFLVPIAQDQDGFQYEAVFTYMY